LGSREGPLEAGERPSQATTGKLTDDDLARVDGKREEFEGVLQERYGKSKDDVRREVDDWLNRI
jgi:uncharacterized protein YjbJ (UPF0337 family)